MRLSLKNFFIPARPQVKQGIFEPNASAVVPTYKPGATALRLVEDLLAHNPKLSVVVVDDCTPLWHATSSQGTASTSTSTAASSPGWFGRFVNWLFGR